MHVVNIHKRIINQPKTEVSPLLETLAAKNDKIWPNSKWPKIRFKNGLKVGEKGGHGTIRYAVEDYIQGELIVFRFLTPKGFDGIHKFEIIKASGNKTEVKHSIIMTTHGLATLQWVSIIRWLHDALIENAFDVIENNFSKEKIVTKWSMWVRLWRFILK
ncbi:hypothetical protein [uncultured Algibacter sp.]|uniref:hypothetical protein n=1 Tax=uncultured Algibacter sp. TaxID=298659 RepID=UPI002629A641|nr:hypothetical protein [uncultured Algibacter sp.]